MVKVIFLYLRSVFLFLLFLHLVAGISINSGVVLNATSLNSSITFSFNITATNFTIEPGYVLIYGISFTNSTGNYLCNNVNHSTANSNLDSSQFNCTLQSAGGSAGGSAGSCRYSWNCTNWSACLLSEKQIRTCSNIGTCPNTYKFPEIEQNCTYTAPESNEEKNQNKTEKDIIKKEIMGKNKLIIYSIIILIIVFIISYLKKDYFKKLIKKIKYRGF